MGECSVVGRGVARVDALAKAVGRLSYVDDLVLPGMLVGGILRSPLPHAMIRHIDTSRAIAIRGVKAVITARDFPERRYGMFVKDQTAMAREKVRYIGEKVAAVAATDVDTVREALELIKVEYEPLEAVFDPLVAVEAGAPLVHEEIERYAVVFDSIIKYGNVCSVSRVKRGDVDKGFAEADLVFEDVFTTPMVHQGYLEPHTCLAAVDAAARVTVWTMTPSVFGFRAQLAEILGVSEDMVRVIAGPVGGSFGGKNDLRLEPVCALLALKAGRPVKMTMERYEEFLDGSPRHAAVMRLKTGVKRDGRLVAREARMIFDTGAYAEFGPAVASEAAKQISGPYRVAHLDVESLCVYTNKVSCGCYRAHGTPEPTFAFESQMDIIAAELGMDPLEIRLKNAVSDGDVSATGEVYRGIALQDNLRRAAERIGWDKPKGVNRGRGIACGQWRTGGRPAGAILKMDETGKVTVSTGCVDVTGSDTVIAQIVAEELGIGLGDVRIISVDTDTSPFDAGSSGTRTTSNVGGVVRAAAQQIQARLRAVASEMLEANPVDLEIANGRIFVKGMPDRFLTVGEVARRLFRENGGHVVGVASSPCRIMAADAAVVSGLCFSGGIEFVHPVQAAEVEVDAETGSVKVLKLVSVHDIGKAINPVAAAGQVEGGLAQGIGYGLSERMICQDGAILNPGGPFHLVPTAKDMPVVEVVFDESEAGLGPYGAKGVAEAPIVPTAPAIANAIYDAIGVRIKSLPIVPEKIVATLGGGSDAGAGRCG